MHECSYIVTVHPKHYLTIKNKNHKFIKTARWIAMIRIFLSLISKECQLWIRIIIIHFKNVDILHYSIGDSNTRFVKCKM